MMLALLLALAASHGLPREWIDLDCGIILIQHRFSPFLLNFSVILNHDKEIFLNLFPFRKLSPSSVFKVPLQASQ